MSLTVEIVRGADTWDLTDQIDWSLSQIAGFGLPPMHRLTQRGPMQHGETDQGFRLDPAITTLAINMHADSQADAYVQRASLVAAFKPSDTALILRVTLPDGSVRCRECHYLRGLEYDSGQWAGWFGNVTVQLTSPEPTWYDPTAEGVTFALGGGGGTFVVPYAVPYEMGASTISDTQTVEYDGTWLTYPVIRVTGPIRDCKITNVTTSETLDFTGTTIGAGEYYEVNCGYGVKTVTDSSGANQIADLSTDSDLATWHLAADPDAEDGANSITVTGAGASAETSVDINWLARFIGI